MRHVRVLHGAVNVIKVIQQKIRALARDRSKLDSSAPSHKSRRDSSLKEARATTKTVHFGSAPNQEITFRPKDAPSEIEAHLKRKNTDAKSSYRTPNRRPKDAGVESPRAPGADAAPKVVLNGPVIKSAVPYWKDSAPLDKDISGLQSLEKAARSTGQSLTDLLAAAQAHKDCFTPEERQALEKHAKADDRHAFADAMFDKAYFFTDVRARMNALPANADFAAPLR
jgi:hypothetical protein